MGGSIDPPRRTPPADMYIIPSSDSNAQTIQSKKQYRARKAYVCFGANCEHDGPYLWRSCGMAMAAMVHVIRELLKFWSEMAHLSRPESDTKFRRERLTELRAEGMQWAEGRGHRAEGCLGCTGSAREIMIGIVFFRNHFCEILVRSIDHCVMSMNTSSSNTDRCARCCSAVQGGPLSGALQPATGRCRDAGREGRPPHFSCSVSLPLARSHRHQDD